MSSKIKVAMLSRKEPDSTIVKEQLMGLDYELQTHSCDSEGEVIEATKDSDIILTANVPITRSVMEHIKGPKAIIGFGHGFNHIDHKAATEHKIMVVNNAGFCSEEVSNHTIMLLLACAKKLAYLNNLVKHGGWDVDTRERILPIVAIDGQTLGLIAFGNIARAVARKAQAFGLQVIAYDPYLPPWIAKEYRVTLVSSLEELASRSDFVSIHTPFNDETGKLVGESFFRAMKPTAYLINTSRGPAVDETALIAALNDGELTGAGLDVFEEEPINPDNPLLSMDNVTVTPHSAGTSNRSRIAAQVQVGQETARLINGTWPMSLVNPEVRATLEGRPPAQAMS